MFGSKKDKARTPAVDAAPVVETPVPAEPEIPAPRTVIGPGIRFEGNIEATEDIEINGRVEGNICSGNTITVTSGGSVQGDISADNFILEGSCEGTAKIAKFCRITSDGSFNGELSTAKLVTEEGSAFEGTLHLQPENHDAMFEIFDQLNAQPEEPETEETGI